MTGYDMVAPAEHNERMDRVLSVTCPKCGATDHACVSPSGRQQVVQHAARWDAWYAAHPEAVTP